MNYTEDRDQAAAELGNADVAVISVNRQFFDTPAYRKALFDFAAAGKGLVMLHPGTWYGYAKWPELNATIVGGGARGHDRIAAFSVKAVKPEHPVMKGVPASFDVEDELYYLNAEADKLPPGTAAIDVLAETSPSVKFMKPHPAVWVTSHPTRPHRRHHARPRSAHARSRRRSRRCSTMRCGGLAARSRSPRIERPGVLGFKGSGFRVQSFLRATIGSTRAARLAGK